VADEIFKINRYWLDLLVCGWLQINSWYWWNLWIIQTRF